MRQVMTFKCYACENRTNEFKVVATADQMRFRCYGYNKKIVECCNCGLVQLYPQWTEEDLNSLYEKYSLKKDFEGQKIPKTITSYLPKYIKKKDTILEIGCGRGDNVKRLREMGYMVIGIDRDPTVQVPDVIFNCEFERFDVHQKFDFIYGIHILEHISDPIIFLNKMVNYLKDNGEFILEIPSVEDPLLKLYNSKAYEQFVWYPYHIYFYSEKTIRYLMDKVVGINVNIIRKQRYGILNHLRWLIKGKPGNLNFHIPIIDDIYKMILTKVFRVSDTLIVYGKRIN